jgi:predicted Zn finger-like uncharacterized protein
MYTRCAHCDTVFRVTPQQLQVSSGKVRCGRCNEVFDAFSSLSAQLPSATQAGIPDPHPIERLEVPPPAWGSTVQEPVSAPASARVDLPVVPDVLAEEVMDVRPHAQDAHREEEATAPAPAAQPSPAAPRFVPAERREEAMTRGSDPGGAGEPVLTLPDELFGAGRPRGPHWAWAAGSALLLALALVQLAWVFATPIARRMPDLRPALEAFCAGAGCRVALPKLPDQLFIDASDLQLLDAARPNEVLLTVTIRNRAPVAQAYPLLELTLTGAANQVASRKVFLPAEYLESGTDIARGIGANQEVSVRLYLSTGTLRAAGYRLYLFFA